KGSYHILLRPQRRDVGHWCAIDDGWWFDSIGEGSPTILGKLKPSSFQYQGAGREFCGIYCMLFLYSRVSIDITQPQARKAGSGKTIMLSASQLKGGSTMLHVHPANYEKMMKAKNANRDCRVCIAPGEIQHDLMQGGSLWSILKETLRLAVKPALSGFLDAAVAPVATALGPYAPAATLDRQAIRSLTGVGVKSGKIVKGFSSVPRFYLEC
ncbi:TPA: hypothetical protein N0F65_009233, partial [Lagenidium giganteum]